MIVKASKYIIYSITVLRLLIREYCGLEMSKQCISSSYMVLNIPHEIKSQIRFKALIPYQRTNSTKSNLIFEAFEYAI